MQDAASSTPPRHLGLTGTYNLRDTGGYRTLDGRMTRWRTLLRSDSLHRVPPLARTALHKVICPPEFMQTTLQYLDEHHDGIPAYVRHIGLSQEQCKYLRQALVE